MFWMRIFSSYESVYIRSMGGSSVIIGAYFAVGGLIRAISSIPGRYLSDTHGYRRIVVIGNYLSSVVWFLIGLAPTWQSYAMAQFLLSVVCFWTIAEYTIKINSIEAKNRGLGLSLFGTIMQLAVLASPYLGGWILENHQTDGLRIVLFIIGAADFGKALFYTKLLKEPQKVHHNKPKVRFHSLVKSFTETFKTMKWMSRSLKGFFIIEVLFGFSWSLVGPFFILYAFDVISLTPLEWGTISTIQIGISLLFRIPGRRLVDRYGKKTFLLVLFIIDAPGSLLFIYSRSYLYVLILFSIWAAIEVLTESSWGALKADLIPKNKRGKVMSLFRLSVASFGFIGSITGGLLYDQNPTLPFLIYILFNIIAAIIGYFVIHEPENPEE